MFTGRDAVHAYLMKHDPPVHLRGGLLYHCGPVVAKGGETILKRYGVRVVIGKGGMRTVFPAIVTMDAHGSSLHKDIEEESGRRLEKLI